jgi:HEAT repeat protein
MDLVIKALEKGLSGAVRQAGLGLAAELAGAKTRERTTLARRIDRFLNSPEGQRDPESAAAAIELLGAILGPAAHARLLDYAAPGHHPALRRRALEALARVAADSDIAEQDLTALLGYLREPDYTNVVAPVMDVLEHARLAPAHTRKLLDCLRSEDPALRRFAVTALGQVDTPQAASALLEVLAGDNPDLRKRAALALANQAAAIPLVVSALTGAEDSQTAWILARILHPHGENLKPEQLTVLARAAALWLEPGDPRAEAVISLLGGDRLPYLADEAVKRVKKMKRERNAGEIVNLLRPLVREGGEIGPQVRYELALAEIVRGKKATLREARLTHPGLKGLEGLVQDAEFGLLGRLKRDKHYLLPEEYYLIGCHFSERTFADRIFGGDLLRWLVKTFPEDNSSEAAANKLLMEGFAPPPRKKPAAPKKAPAKKKVAVAKKKAPAKKKVAVAKKKAPAKKKAATKKIAKKKAPAKKKAATKKVAKKKAAKRPRR